MSGEHEILRQQLFAKRLDELPGGNRVHWSARDIGVIRQRIWDASIDEISRVASAARGKQLDATATPNQDVRASKAQADSHSFLFTISSSRVDRAGDTIDQRGIDLTDFRRNSPVLNAHDSSKLPIAVSDLPFISASGSLAAVARFPDARVNFDADKVLAAIRAGLVRGASVGFIPLRWTFVDDPARPFGVDFKATSLLEWSVCSVPCNADCLLVGAVNDAKALPADQRETRVAEARKLKRLLSVPGWPYRA